VAGRGRSCFTISLITSHLGIKPERGGKPPKESRTGVSVAARMGVLAQEVARLLRLVQLKVFRVKKAIEVMIMYKNRLRRAIGGANWRMRAIHPRWAMEE